MKKTRYVYDPCQMRWVYEEKEDASAAQKQKYNYDVTVHLVAGGPVNFVVLDSDLTKIDLLSNINSKGYIVVCEESVSINMRNVTYIEVKEITND